MKPVKLDDNHYIIDISDYFNEVNANKFFIVRCGDVLFGECVNFEFSNEHPSGYETMRLAASAFRVTA